MLFTNCRRVVTLMIVAVVALGGMIVVRSSLVVAPVAEERVTVELTANTWRPNRQVEPTIAADSDGNLLIAWASRRQEDGGFGVYAQLLDPLGRPIGTEVHVNQQIKGSQVSPAVAFDPHNGRALIVWESTHQDGSGAGIVGRWFEISPLGAHAVTDELAINAGRQGEQTKPSVAINEAGVAMVAWTSEVDQRFAAISRAFDRAGLPLTDDFNLGMAGAHSPIVAASNSEFVIIGSSRDSNGRPAPLWMQRINDDMTPGNPSEVAATYGEQDIEPSIGVDDSGRTIVAWMRRGDRGYDVIRREFDAAGYAIKDEAVVAHAGKWLSGVTIAMAPDGRSIISWNEEEKIAPVPVDGHRATRDSDVLMQRFDAYGASVGKPTCIHLDSAGRQWLSVGAVAARSVWTDADQIAHVWHGVAGDDHRGVGVTLSYPEGLTAPTPIAFEPRPAFTPSMLDQVGQREAAPVFDPNFVPDPLDVNVRSSGPDFGFIGAQQSGWRPPDPDIAVGPDHVVVVVNAQIVIRNKSNGVQTFSQSLTGANGFWGAQGAGGSVFDPIAQYDTHTDRYIVAAAETFGDDPYLNIAISEDSDPNGDWIKHRVNMAAHVGGTGGFLDYPILGVDEQSISITANYYGDPLSAWVFVFDKAALIAGVVSLNPVQVSTFNPPTGAVMNYDENPPAQYYATPWSAGQTFLRLLAITDPNGTPTLFEHQLPVPMFATPPDADQLGSTNLADTVDWRIKHGVVRNGSMWMAHTVRVVDDGGGPFQQDPIARVRWYEIELNGWPVSGMDPSLRQAGTLNYGTGIHTWYPDISVDDAGNAAIVFNRSSVDEYISVSRAVRRVTDPLGTFRQSVTMQTSTTPEENDRWGDYSGIQEDPVAPGVFWGHSEYRTSSWRTWVGRFSPLTPNPLDFALLSPTDEAVKVSIEATLDWEDAEDADSYDVVIATDPDLVNTVETTNVTGSSWSIAAGTLACDTRYFWGVIANGVGGTSVSTPGVFSFTTGLLADLNGDNIVDTADLGVLISVFGTAGPAGDLNGDGVVDTADLGILIGAFGSSCN